MPGAGSRPFTRTAPPAFAGAGPKGSYTYNRLKQLASRTVTNAGPFNGTLHTVQDRSGNVIAGADGTTGVVAKEYIWLPGAGYAGTDLPVGVVEAAGTANPELTRCALDIIHNT